MIKVIVNADDFGYSRGTNFGIIDAHQYGVVNSATMMMNMTAVDHAFELASENKELAVGIHLVLTAGTPLIQTGVSSLIQENGKFKTQSMLMNQFDMDPGEVEKEWEAQIHKFLSYGVKPNHMDSHHHVHTLPELEQVVRRLSKKYNLPVRVCNIEDVEMYSDIGLFDFYDSGVTENYFDELPNKVMDGQTVEIMCHPAYIDTILQSGTSYCSQRLKELDILMKAKLPEQCELIQFEYLKINQ